MSVQKKPHTTTANCEECDQEVAIIRQRQTVLCPKCRWRRNGIKKRKHRLDAGRSPEEHQAMKDWMPTPREILERRIKMHQIGTQAETPIDRQLIDKAQQQLDELPETTPRDPHQLLIGELHLSESIVEALEEAGIKTVADLLSLTRDELRELTGITKYSEKRLFAALHKEYGSDIKSTLLELASQQLLYF